MRVSRSFSVRVQYILDQWVPPRVRDSKWFMYLPMKFVLKDATADFMNFKNWVFEKSDEDFKKLYERTGHVQELQGETDLNEACLKKILASVKNNKVLEVGCGRGFLAGKLVRNNQVTACDIVIPEKAVMNYPKVTFVEADIEHLPFADNEFEVVITTHTLEHVRNLAKSLSELRRVAKRELIIVVPKQRPYKYTFSLHTQFFPYRWSLQSQFGYSKHTTILDLGDWFYRQKMNK